MTEQDLIKKVARANKRDIEARAASREAGQEAAAAGKALGAAWDELREHMDQQVTLATEKIMGDE